MPDRLVLAESCFVQAHAAYFCAMQARQHARTLSGPERRECFAYVRAELYRARKNIAWSGAYLGLVPCKGVSLLEVLHARGWSTQPTKNHRRSIYNTAGQLLFTGDALAVWRWLRATKEAAETECPSCRDGRNPKDGSRICLNCHGSHKVRLAA